jgi:hypothetical protein
MIFYDGVLAKPASGVLVQLAILLGLIRGKGPLMNSKTADLDLRGKGETGPEVIR